MAVVIEALTKEISTLRLPLKVQYNFYPESFPFLKGALGSHSH